MKYIVYILFFFPVWVTAQTYKYIGIEDGLSNRRIFNIQKDAQGYYVRGQKERDSPCATSYNWRSHSSVN